MRVHVLLGLVVATACGGSDGGTPPATNTNKTIDILTVADAFSPTFQTASPGDTVRWTFSGGSDGMGHNVRFSPIIAGSPNDINVTKSGSVTRVFTTKGDYRYVCDVHPGMIGEVIVQ